MNQIPSGSSCGNKKTEKTDEVVAPICGWIYKEGNYTLIPWSGIDPDS